MRRVNEETPPDRWQAGGGVEGANESFSQVDDTTNGQALKPDMQEAQRLLDAGMTLVKLHPYEKRPIGENWNKRPVKRIDPDATGYGLPLAANGLCSIDPDHMEMARQGLAAWGFDLDDLLAAGVRTESTRAGSGGRAAFQADPEGMARWLTFKVFDDEGNGTTVLELRANSANLQDCVPGLVYADKATGELCTQRYASAARFDDAPALPDDFARLWRQLSFNDEEYREFARMFHEGIAAAGFEVNGQRPQHRPPMGAGRKLAFPAPGYRQNFNSRHTVEEILIEHGYSQDGRDGRYAHPGATGAPGIRPIPGKDDLWQSDHGGDPLHGTFDAWAAHVQLNHGGDVDAAIAHEPDPNGDVVEQFPEITEGTAETTEGKSKAPVFDLDAARVGELLDSDPPPLRWLIDQRVPLDVVGLLAAAGGTGKSMATLQLAVSVATGLPWLDMPVGETGEVVMFSAEDDRGEIHRRLHRVVHAVVDAVDPFDPDPAEQHRKALKDRLFIFDCVGADNRLTFKVNGETQRTLFANYVIEAVNQLENCKLIVLDPLSRFDGGEPNDNADGTRLIEAAEYIRRHTGATVLLPHHVSKASMKDSDAGQEAVRGASGLVDGARWVGVLAGLRKDDAKRYGVDEDDVGRYVRFTTPMSNYSAPWGGCWLERQAGGVLVPSELKPRKEDQKERKAEQEYREIVRRIVDVLERHGPMTRRKLCKEYSGATGPLGAGDQKIRGVINRALDEGELITTKPPGETYEVVAAPEGNFSGEVAG